MVAQRRILYDFRADLRPIPPRRLARYNAGSMLEALSDKLTGVFQKLGSHGTITEKDLDEAMREVRIALLEADVNFKVVRSFISTVRERALGAEVLKSLTGPQQVIGIVNEELVNILGGSQSTLQLASKPPTVIMLVGLKGSGKTTTAAKLGLHLRKSGAKPMLVAADPYRMAAGEHETEFAGQERAVRVAGIEQPRLRGRHPRWPHPFAHIGFEGFMLVGFNRPGNLSESIPVMESLLMQLVGERRLDSILLRFGRLRPSIVRDRTARQALPR